MALVSSWGSNEELAAFAQTLGERFTCFVKTDRVPPPGERVEDDLLIRADKNPNTRRGARAVPALPTPAPRFADDTDLVLVWGEGFDFADAAAAARRSSSSTPTWQPENAHADVFIPISVQTERSGHYTNFAGRRQRVRACFAEAGRRGRRAGAVRRAGTPAVAGGARA